MPGYTKNCIPLHVCQGVLIYFISFKTSRLPVLPYSWKAKKKWSYISIPPYILPWRAHGQPYILGEGM